MIMFLMMVVFYYGESDNYKKDGDDDYSNFDEHDDFDDALTFSIPRLQYLLEQSALFAQLGITMTMMILIITHSNITNISSSTYIKTHIRIQIFQVRLPLLCAALCCHR